MEYRNGKAVAIVGLGAILPDAMEVASFWNNIVNQCYSIIGVPPGRWDPADYYDPSPVAPDKTYSKIGGWVQGFLFNWKDYRIPPKVAASMDAGQQWAISMTSQALADYGFPSRELDSERTAVVLGTAMGGEMHYLTHLRISFPEYAKALESVERFRQLPVEIRKDIRKRWQKVIEENFPLVTEDSMPGELPNIVAGRVANVFNFRGPSYITDAACAASFAAVNDAVQILVNDEADSVLTGGIDHNMSAASFVKFSKIGALSATGSRPFGEGADGFVMGEGAAIFLLKRLEAAEKDGDKIYAVIRGVGGSSDGRGKGITAPNPVGQQLAMRRAWEDAGLDPTTATLIEAHGTSTKVGDVVEYESLMTIFGAAPRHSIALGSVKSNIGHLKAGAGAASLLKSVLALHHKILPPTLNARQPNPSIDFSNSPFFLNHEAREWTNRNEIPRRCGVSAYGFGGTNFHLVLEEYIPGLLTQKSSIYTGASLTKNRSSGSESGEWAASISNTPATLPNPLRGILAIGAENSNEIKQKLHDVIERVQAGWIPSRTSPDLTVLEAPERLVIDFGNPAELRDRIAKALKGLDRNDQMAWNAMQAMGIFRGSGSKPGKIAFLFPGQGSQYLNMGRQLAEASPVVKGVFEEADKVMAPILGKPLSQYIFLDEADPQAIQAAEENLMQTAITQPAMLTLDIAIYRLLETYGFKPDFVMGHSLGEYAGLIVSGIMPFEDALEAAAARGREMSSFQTVDNGWMAAVIAPHSAVEKVLEEVEGYVVAANLNSYSQCVIGGASRAVEEAIRLFQEEGYQAKRIPVSHAFHTRIVASASDPLRRVLDRLRISPPRLPMVANFTGDFYPAEVEAIKDLLQQQVASPVQWIKGLERLYAAGARTFIEVGPKKALKGFVDDVFSQKGEVLSLFTNHPKVGELASFNQALCGLYAAGYLPARRDWSGKMNMPEHSFQAEEKLAASRDPVVLTEESANQFMFKAFQEIFAGYVSTLQKTIEQPKPFDRNSPPAGSIVISGTGLGLPGSEKAIMDPQNAMRILRGEQFIDLLPERFRKRILQKQVTRIVKSENGNGRFETIANPDEVIRIGGRPGTFNLAEEYGVPGKLVEVLDITSQLAMAAGLDSLREAGIPMVQAYRRTTIGKLLPDRWMLPEALRDETGVIFASAFPGGERFAEELSRYYIWQNRADQIAVLEDLRQCTADPETQREISRRIGELRNLQEREPYEFDRRFIFRILAMGHSQFAEYIGARGPNTHVNAACASTTQAIAIAEDWIQSGRCRRVIVIAADNVTGDRLLEWIGTGLLALGAAAIDDCVEEAALPFDRRRHGTVLGMGACALVIESEDAVRERGMRGIVELLGSEIRNSAYHGSRLDVDHMAEVMDDLVTSVERRFGLNRHAIAQETVFMSHETYTPARGGSASAEVVALRKTFGDSANDIVIANTKGFTGHPMGVGVEDVIAVNILEYGIVPPVPNCKELDREFGELNLSRGGRYPVHYALHLAAGFGSQIAMNFIQRIPGNLDRLDNTQLYQRWLDEVSGYDRAETEIVKRVLRIKSKGAPIHSTAPSLWQMGTGPVTRTFACKSRGSHDGHPTDFHFTQRGSIQSMPSLPAAAPMMIEPAPEPVSISSTLPDSVEAVQAAPAHQAETQSRETNDPKTEDTDFSAKAQIVPAVDAVADQVLDLVAEKTGYPKDMLELDLDLEADLGIDTVKQAETFLAIRETFNIPRRDDLQLRSYPTLAHVIQFVHEMRPDLAAKVEQPSKPDVEIRKTEEERSFEASNPGANPNDLVIDKVLSLVAEKTGYPKDMLELDLDLEADLGIDTVKQAETFLAIRETFDIPRRDDLQLRDYPTLGHVIQFVREMRPEMGANSEEPEKSDQVKTQDMPREEFLPKQSPPPTQLWSLAEADRIPRRIPVPMLRPVLEICKLTKITFDEKSRIVVMLDRVGVGKSLVQLLEKLGVCVLTIQDPPSTQALEVQLAEWLEKGPIRGVYWLTALEKEPYLEDIDLETWRELNRQRVKNLYTAMRCLYESINAPGAFLITGTCLGGLHGYGPEGATAPLGGAITGFAKAFKRECSQAVVKTIDFDMDCLKNESGHLRVAERLIAETLFDPGVVEVGYRNEERYTIGLVEQPVTGDDAGLSLHPDSVFVISGAAGSITSAIVSDLADFSGGSFYLLDRISPPDPGNPGIALFRKDREELKEWLIAEMRAVGKRPTPALIEKQIQAIEREEAALRAIEAVTAAGGKPYYRCVDLMDAAAVNKVFKEIRKRHGGIDVLIHAAGVEISHSLPEKDPQQFDLVFGVKADGFFNLLKSAKGMPIGATVAFSSVAGRFGNAGQTDYSAANDLLCKITSSMRNWRPETRAIAIDWTAWSGIGMATRGSIPKIMEMAGIEMLPPECGVPAVRRELTRSSSRGEVLVAGALGLLEQEWDESGGLDEQKAAEWLLKRKPDLLMVGKLKSAHIADGFLVETELDPKVQPFLYDHQMEGTPILPGAMGTEAFAELSSALAPGYTVTRILNENFHHPFKFYRMESQKLYWNVTALHLNDNELRTHATLRSIRQPTRPGLKLQEKIHFSAEVHLAKEPREKPVINFSPPPPEEMPIASEQIYRVYFHGPAYQVLERVRVDKDSAIGLMSASLPPDTSPTGAANLIAPRLIELCFQTVGVWEIQSKRIFALPMRIGSVSIYGQPEEAKAPRSKKQRFYAVVEAIDNGEMFNVQVVDESGAVYIQLEGYQTVQLPVQVELV